MANPELIQNPNAAPEKNTDPNADSIHEANVWIQENYGKTLGILGAIALAGVVGYLVGKNTIQNEFQLPTPRG